MVVSCLREEAGGASTGEAREVARKPADALPGYVKQTKGGLWSRREGPKFIGGRERACSNGQTPGTHGLAPTQRDTDSRGHVLPPTSNTHSFPAAPGAHFPGSHPHHTSPPSWRAGAHAKERRQMSNVADNPRRLVVEGEGAPDVVRNQLLLALVDAVEKLTAEQVATNRELARIGSALMEPEQ